MKRWIVSIAAAWMMLLPAFSMAEQTILTNTDSVKAAVLMEQQSSTRLWAINADQDCSVAGLSKLPALLTLSQSMDDGTINPTSEITISEHAASIQGPTAFLEKGESVPASILMKAAIMISAGDAIVSLGESAFGSESVFVENINTTLRQLGLQKTVVDSVGSNLKLTAWELATLGKAAAESKTFSQYCALYLDSVSHADGRETELVNANRLLKSYPGCCGIMTGSSADDGYCGVFYAKRNKTNLIAVVVGAENAAQRSAAATAMLDHGFTAFRTETLVKADTPVGESVPVRNGNVKMITLAPAETVTVVLENAAGKITKTMELPKYLEAPLDPKTAVCEIVFTKENGETVARVPLYPTSEVISFGVSDILRRIMAIFCG